MASPNTIPNNIEPKSPFIVVSLTNILKLTTTNYLSWRLQIEATLIGYDLFKFLDGTYQAPSPTIVKDQTTTANPAYHTWVRQDKLLFGALIGTLDPTIVPLVSRSATSMEVWNTLENTFAKQSRGHQKLLKANLKSITKGPQTVTEYMNAIKICTDQLALLGCPVTNEDITEKVLEGLDTSYQAVIDAVNARDSPITFDELHEKLLNRELAIRSQPLPPIIPAWEIELSYPMANADVGPSIQQTLLDCKENGQKLSGKLPPSIYMVPSSLRELSPCSFKPRVVSIGPLHRDDKILQEFEEQKTTHLHHLLECLNIQPGIILDECLEKVNASIPKIRGCYGGIINCKDPELAKMMVMDACFILDFLFLSKEYRRLTSRNAILTHSILRDLVLLENQIPFFVLQDIFKCTIYKIQPHSLTSGVLAHLQFLIPFKGIKENSDVIGTTTQPHHILGLLQKYFHPTGIIPSTCPPLKVPNHSALELHQAGVKFKPNSEDGNHWPLAIDFSSSSFQYFRWWWGNRTLRMPKLHIDDNTELFLRNVIAYEQCTPDVPDYITSYACAIDMLIDTKEDLSKLVESEVLSNHLGSNKDATKMLNNISKQFVFDEFYYTEQWERLHGYYDGYVPKNIALLKRTYFSSPWSIIALLAAIVLFSLAITQTILRIMTF